MGQDPNHEFRVSGTLGTMGTMGTVGTMGTIVRSQVYRAGAGADAQRFCSAGELWAMASVKGYMGI